LFAMIASRRLLSFAKTHRLSCQRRELTEVVREK
jgi:hypothetical protein